MVWMIIEEQDASGDCGTGCRQCTDAAQAVRDQSGGYFGKLEHTGRVIRTVREDAPDESGCGYNETYLLVALMPPKPRLLYSGGAVNYQMGAELH